ncbi:MAG: arginine--tRNA ligase [Bulleidia sp.]
MSDISEKLIHAIHTSVQEAFDVECAENMVMVERPRDPKMGDYSTNIAMRLARTLRRKPIDIANDLIPVLKKNISEASEITSAGPGFINFVISSSALTDVINTIIAKGAEYGKSDTGNGEKVLVEFVSANPTGDLHCGHARGAAWGDALCRIMDAAGYNVTREYYVNDAGHQIEMLAESIYSRYCELYGVDYPLPETGYHAHDIVEVAEKIREKDGDKWLNRDKSVWEEYFKDEGIEMKLDVIRQDLDLFRVHFDSWMHERFFYQNNAERIQKVIDELKARDLVFEQDGAVWFRSTQFGDDKDRVLKKNTGLLTYLTPDIANHVYKFERGFDTLVNLWGSDHHSYVKRMKCAMEALGYDPDRLVVDLIQMVRMVSNGVEVKMSKRTGNAITIRELCEDVGVDAARWFFVSKELNTQMDFDMDLAKQKNNDNPVYYVQYAYTRMFNILHKEGTPEFRQVEHYDLLTDPKEIELTKQISEFPKKVEDAAKQRAVNRICNYCYDLAKLFHSYYNSCRVNDPSNPELTNQRLGLVSAAMITMKNALDLIGVSAPEKM